MERCWVASKEAVFNLGPSPTQQEKLYFLGLGVYSLGGEFLRFSVDFLVKTVIK